METLSIILKTSAITGAFSALFTAFLQTWFKHRFDLRLEVEKDRMSRELEDYRADLKRKEQAIQLAEVLSDYFSENDECRRFNKALWEIALTMPPEVMAKIQCCLSGEDPSMTVKDLLAYLRQKIEPKAAPLPSDTIVHRGRLHSHN